MTKRGASVPARGIKATSAPRGKPGGQTGPRSRGELYEMAQRRDLPGRSSMNRDELARKLGVR
ncbi:MAG: hypothetical protein ACR2FU_14900 [Streptosporangiaceae bacterium]